MSVTKEQASDKSQLEKHIKNFRLDCFLNSRKTVKIQKEWETNLENLIPSQPEYKTSNNNRHLFSLRYYVSSNHSTKEKCLRAESYQERSEMENGDKVSILTHVWVTKDLKNNQYYADFGTREQAEEIFKNIPLDEKGIPVKHNGYIYPGTYTRST